MISKILIWIFVSTVFIFAINKECSLPKEITFLEVQTSLDANSDVSRNAKSLNELCTHVLSFKEGKYTWQMMLVYNPKRNKNVFYFLPHDDEDTAFDAAVYATKKYGGGFLSIMANNHRSFRGQDPNRNFSNDKYTAKICRKQKYPAPLYSSNIFNIINTFKKLDMPYIALHNNKNGWYGNGGNGGVSILKSSAIVKSYVSNRVRTGIKKGLKDEDSLVYIAGKKRYPPKKKLSMLLNSGIHVKYEIVSQKSNDCSMSNYVVLNKGENYYNIETEHGDLKAQKIMIDKLMKLLKIKAQ